jgi:hypothetical protein
MRQLQSNLKKLTSENENIKIKIGNSGKRPQELCGLFVIYDTFEKCPKNFGVSAM